MGIFNDDLTPDQPIGGKGERGEAGPVGPQTSKAYRGQLDLKAYGGQLEPKANPAVTPLTTTPFTEDQQSVTA